MLNVSNNVDTIINGDVIGYFSLLIVSDLCESLLSSIVDFTLLGAII